MMNKTGNIEMYWQDHAMHESTAKPNTRCGTQAGIDNVAVDQTELQAAVMLQAFDCILLHMVSSVGTTVS